MVTPLRKAASYEQRIYFRDLGVIRGLLVANTASTWQYVVFTGPLRGLRDAFWKVERHFKLFKILQRKNQPSLLSCLLRGGNEDTLVVLRNAWHYVIIRRRKF